MRTLFLPTTEIKNFSKINHIEKSTFIDYHRNTISPCDVLVINIHRFWDGVAPFVSFGICLCFGSIYFGPRNAVAFHLIMERNLNEPVVAQVLDSKPKYMWTVRNASWAINLGSYLLIMLISILCAIQQYLEFAY